MNAKEARLAIDVWNSDSMHKSLDSMGKMLSAQGYLACLEGPEVKALVEALKKIQVSIDRNETIVTPEIEDVIESALSTFKQAAEGNSTTNRSIERAKE